MRQTTLDHSKASPGKSPICLMLTPKDGANIFNQWLCKDQDLVESKLR